MIRTTYNINVDYKGDHDFTVTVDMNGPSDVNIASAKEVARMIRRELGSDYQVSVTAHVVASVDHGVTF